jgi:hypothetical protein
MWTLPNNYDKLQMIRLDTTTPPFAIESNLPDNCIPISQVQQHDNFTDYLEPLQALIENKPEIELLEMPTELKASATFHDFIQTLPAVERIVLEQCYEVDPTGPSLIEILSDRELCAELLLVTDGGAAHNHGSFGWVIGTLETELWKCKGPAHGLPIHSFRAESVGVLSITWFLDRFCEFYEIKPFKDKPTLWLGTDSLSFLDRIKELKDIPIPDWYPSVYAYPDIDVTLEIFKTLESHQFAYVMNHVKGHEDDKQPYEELKRPNQLNVQADALATEALREQQWEDRPIFFPMPHCKVYLKANGIYQCNHELLTCRTALPLAQSKSYFKKRYQWTDQIYNDIDWDAFSKTRKKMDTLHTFITKLVTGWLPVNHRQARIEHIPSKCPLCPQEETVDHLAQCPSRNHWQQDFISRFRKTMKEQRTCPNIQDEILQASTSWLKGELQDYSTHPQAMIGWNLLHRGFMSKTWSERQKFYVRMYRPDLGRDSKEREKLDRWAEVIIQFIWTELHQLWKNRCEWVHRKTEQHSSTQDQIRASASVRALYQHANDIGYHDRKIFDMPMEDRLKHSPRDLFAWVSSMQPAIVQARRQHAQRSTSNTHDIRDYFIQPEPRYDRKPKPRIPQTTDPETSDHNHTT